MKKAHDKVSEKRRKGSGMRVEVDESKCETAGICVQGCPEVFRFQEGSKKAAVIKDGVPPSLEEKCREIADMCPAKAIRVFE
jgi:ferredoxin